MIRKYATLAWICIKQPRLALMLWRARRNIPELQKMRRALDKVDRR